ncbi:protein FAR1-RELATED SEQUENCE 5-like [Fagus crenata]
MTPPVPDSTPGVFTSLSPPTGPPICHQDPTAANPSFLDNLSDEDKDEDKDIEFNPFEDISQTSVLENESNDCIVDQEKETQVELTNGSSNRAMDYRVIDIKGNTQEFIGKRYSHLSHEFREICTLAAEGEMMYECTKRYFQNILKDLQEMRKKFYSNSMEVHGDVLLGDGGIESHGNITSQGNCRIKTKPTVGRPKRRLKNALEQRKNAKSRSKINKQKVDSSHEKHSNVRQVSQLMDNLTQV